MMILLFMVYITYEDFRKVLRNAPNKIKMICIGIFICTGLRYATLITLFLINSIRYLYLLKPFYFLNLISMPIGALVAIYILIRNDKVKFSYIFLISGIFIGVYGYLIYKLPFKVAVSSLYGYYIEIIKFPYVYIGYMLLNAIFIIFIIILSHRNVYRIGIKLVLLASIVSILETAAIVLGFGVYENIIISDMLWMVTLGYSIGKLKKSGR